jgi:lycopene cyclase domain-containing protein
MLANVPITLVFILWDAYFTRAGVWGFNDRYTTGTTWLYLPWEEWMFFVLIPFACVFIYWALGVFMQKEIWPQTEKIITRLLILIFLITGITQFDKIYTATTALLAGFFLLYHSLYLGSEYRMKFYFMFLLSCIPFLLVNGALTGALTIEPVVMYHEEEILGIRIRTIPVEDAIYSFLMLMGNVTVFEEIRKIRRTT